MQLALYILGVILGYILCSVLHNRKAHGEIFIIKKEDGKIAFYIMK